MSSLSSEGKVPQGLVETWRADTPSPAELHRGYGRFLRTQSRSGPARLLGRWLVLGALLGGGLAQGATIVAKRWESAHVRSLTVSAPAAPKPSVNPSPPMPRAPAPVVTLAPQPELPSASPEPRASAPAAPTAPESLTSARASSRRWQQAAAAMRVNDFAGADSALRELEQTTQGSERDAVLLTRAQLLAGAGRNAEALALARLVQARTSSGMMRDKAGELARRLSNSPSSDRSNQPGAAINQP